MIRNKRNSLGTLYSLGSWLKGIRDKVFTHTTTTDENGENHTKWGLTDATKGTLTSAAPAIGGLVKEGANKLIGGNYKSGVGDVVGGIGSAAGDTVSTFNPVLGAGIKAASGVLQGGIKALAGYQVDEAGLARLADYQNQMNMFQFNDSDNASVLADAANLDFGGVGLDREKYKDTLLNHRGSREYERDMALLNSAIQTGINKLNVAALNADRTMDLNILENYAAFGGNLETNGGIFSNNGIVHIGNGGTHELNPNEGVQIGVDNEGVPNLVEEGEVLAGNYVFSNRLKVPKRLSKKYKLDGIMSFADAIKEVTKESEERPNDPISKNNTMHLLSEFAIAQEEKRNKRQRNRYKEGGCVNKYGDGTEDLDTPNSKADIELFVSKLKELLPDISDGPKVDDPYRKAPIVGNLLGLLSTVFSKPDRRGILAILNAGAIASTPRSVTYTPVSGGFTPTLIDPNLITNKQIALAEASRNAIQLQSNGNRGAAITGILASDFGTIGLLGEGAIQLNKENNANKLEAAKLASSIAAQNSLLGLDASKTNAQLSASGNELWLNTVKYAQDLKQKQDQEREAALSANATALFDNMGALGQQNIINDHYRWGLIHGAFAPFFSNNNGK